MVLTAIIKARVFIRLVFGTGVQVVLVPPALQPPDMSGYFRCATEVVSI